MAVIDILLQSSIDRPLTFLLAISSSLLLLRCVYRVAFHPLAHIPGPLLPKLSSLWLYYHAYVGDEATVIHQAHARYGPIVRVSPNEVDISDGEAVTPIYVTKGGFPKAQCYANFDIDGHKTIFSTTDSEYRAPRAKAVVSMFSTKSIRDNLPALYGCVDRMVERMQEEANTGKPVNLLNLSRALAVDAVSTHLFQQNYNGTSEKGNKLSVSAFVDAFVAVGRFFYLPNLAFVWVEWALERCFPDEHTAVSMEVVDKFVEELVDSTPRGALNYPGRLMSLGLEKSEIKCQCKDLIFAGTDSVHITWHKNDTPPSPLSTETLLLGVTDELVQTGMNLATIFRQLALNPEKHEILRQELLSNSNSTPKQDIQSLPYLSGVVKEALRISMANPTRLPHVVPFPGWTFKSTHFPAGTLLGCSAFELHLDESIFPNPLAFQPERWLEGNATAAMSRDWFAFGAGPRACIARNLATVELFITTEKVVESGVLKGAKVCQEEVEIYEWFNSKVKGEKMELVWPKQEIES